MNIALIYDIARWEERALLEASRKLSVNMTPLHVKSKVFPVEGLRENADIGLQRSLSHALALSSTVLFESSGLRVVNTSKAISLAQDKLWTLTLLSKAGIPTPKTVVAFSEQSAMEAAKMIGYPVVVKPVNGSWGKLVSLVEDDETLRVILEHKAFISNPQFKIHLIQEYVRKPGRDIRVFVVGDEVPVAIYRVSSHWITNTARGGLAMPAPIDEELGNLALKASEALGVEVSGIDVFEDPERGYLVNEINAVPDFRNTVAVTGYDLPAKMVEYLVREAKR
ncbi:MAG: lysine biosynthesis protein LysX [Thermoprotei archaeon]|nr:lysine biosynthesis protein LysX [Thermoprotei archaeon]